MLCGGKASNRLRRFTALILIGLQVLMFVPALPRPALAAAPQIQSISPGKGGIGGGYTINIVGFNFAPDSTVKIDGKKATVIEFLPDSGGNPGRLTVQVPGGNSIGAKDVLVQNPDTLWDLMEGGFEYVEGPVITSVTPNTGLVGDFIEIMGSNFLWGYDLPDPDTLTPAVLIGGVEVPLQEAATDIKLKVRAPSGLSGTVSVEVVLKRVSDGSLTDRKMRIPEGFTYTTALSNPQISGFSPDDVGLTIGGEQMDILGSDFRVGVGPLGPIYPVVKFGSATATILSVNTTTITVLTPSNTTGYKDVKVTNPDGQVSNARSFLYVIPEKETTISSITPNQGSREGGALVAVSMVNPPLKNEYFPDGKIEVYIGGILSGSTTDSSLAVEYDPDNPDLPRTLKAYTPGGPEGTVDVIVLFTLNDGALVEVRYKDGFNYLTPSSHPTISSVEPGEGPLNSEIPVTIKGNDFRSPGPGEEIIVRVGFDEAANVLVVDTETIQAIFPASGTPGVRDVIVENPDGATARLRNGFTYRGSSLRIDTITPNYGSVSGGTEVVIRGANFSTDVSGLFVEFGGLDSEGQEHWEVARFKGGAPSVQSDGEGEKLVVITPAHTEGVKDVRVSNAYGSYTKPASFTYLPPSFASPMITGAEPQTGPVSGQVKVTLSGLNFATGAVVYIGEWKADPSKTVVLNENTIEFYTPTGEPGWYPVKVVNIDGKEGIWWNDPAHNAEGDPDEGYYYYSNPKVNSVTLAKGSTTGGGIVTITGEQFYNGIRVYFGPVAGQEVEASGVYRENTTTLQVRLPQVGEAAQGVNVRIENIDGGTYAYEGKFEFITIPVDKQPSIQTVVPDFGPTTGGNEVIITGTNFAPNPAVYLGSPLVGWKNATVKSVTRSEIKVVVPAHPEGSYDVVVINKDFGVATNYSVYTYQEAQTIPTIQSVTPSRGTKSGGTYVTVTGTDFWEGARVFFGAVEANPAWVEVRDSTVLKVYSPEAGSTGTVDIKVVNPDGGSALKSSAFTYLTPGADYLPVVTGVSPEFGTTAGGTLVTISGTNFWPGIEVFFDGVPGTGLQRVDSNTILVKTPAHQVGLVDVTVANQDGGAYTYYDPAATPAKGFWYAEPGSSPAITGISPAQGRAGEITAVTISGRDFRPSAKVLFGVTEAVVDEVYYDTILVRAPALPKGKVDVTVVNQDLGSVVLKNGFEYKSSVPKILSVAPAEGKTAGGDTVVIKGQDFRQGSNFKVYFGANLATVASWLDDNTIKVTTPTGPLGYVTVRVVNNDLEEATKANGFLYKNPASEPTITGVDPAQGPTTGGTWVDITGTQFWQEARVYFQGEASPDVRVVSESLIRAKVPAYQAGAVDVTVVNYDGGSATASGAFTYVTPGSSPRIDGLNPSKGPTLGGTEVTITGMDFRVGIRVFIDGVAVSEANTTRVDYRTVRVITPPGAAGAKDVTVVNTDQGIFTLAKGFTYYAVSVPVVATVSPNQGLTTGGTSITINGDKFVKGASVWIGGRLATDVQVVNSTTITATTPAGSEGWQEVKVTNPDGGWGVKANGFYYQRPRTAPDSPGWLSAYSVDDRTIRLNFGWSEFANYYDIFISETSSGTYRFLTQTSSTSYYATGLQPDTKYYFKVRAVNELGASSFSNYDYAYTKEEESSSSPPAPQTRITLGSGQVIITIPTEDAFRSNYRVDLTGPEYRQSKRWEVTLPGRAAKNATRNLIVDTGGFRLMFTSGALWTPGIANLSSSDLDGSWVRLAVSDTGQGEAEAALKVLPKGSRILSPVYSVSLETQVGRKTQRVDLFYGTVTLDLTYRADSLSNPEKRKLDIYVYKPSERQWVALGGTADPYWPTVSADIKQPGRYVLVEQP